MTAVTAKYGRWDQKGEEGGWRSRKTRIGNGYTTLIGKLVSCHRVLGDLSCPEEIMECPVGTDLLSECKTEVDKFGLTTKESHSFVSRQTNRPFSPEGTDDGVENTTHCQKFQSATTRNRKQLPDVNAPRASNQPTSANRSSFLFRAAFYDLKIPGRPFVLSRQLPVFEKRLPCLRRRNKDPEQALQ